MLKIIEYPEGVTWDALCERPSLDVSEMGTTINAIFEGIKKKGDNALIDFAKKFDGVELASVNLDISEEEFFIDADLAIAIKQAKSNIEQFHLAQKEDLQPVETVPGVWCWRKSLPIKNVGLYIPGGSAPLFSTLLMLAIPAKIAGCENIVICTPPQKASISGARNVILNEVIGWTCQLLDINKIYLSGGAQAVAAMTYGTESIPRVDKIFGPGNQFVTAAKLMSQQLGVAIDMPAGPSEVLVIADDSAEPSFVAADLLSQAEHGPDSQVVLVTNSEKLIEHVKKEIKTQLELLPRQEIASKALENSRVVLFNDLAEATAFSNHYAPEHLIIATENCEALSEQITTAGSVFLGNWSCESAGDYASGTNHTLPTNGYARNYSGVSLDSFIKKITFQKLSEQGIKNLGPTIEKMAKAEQLQAHKNAVTIRLQSLKNSSSKERNEKQFPFSDEPEGRKKQAKDVLTKQKTNRARL
ncbi:MAG: histidinol dehydrogenase [Bacteroidota bacterium]